MAVKAANLVLQEIKNKRNAQINVSNIFNKTQLRITGNYSLLHVHVLEEETKVETEVAKYDLLKI